LAEIGSYRSNISGYFYGDVELSPYLHGLNKYMVYNNILLNTPIVSAGVNFFLGMVRQAKWTFTPSEADKSGEFAALAEDIILNKPEGTWADTVERLAMAKFFGFAVQEVVFHKRDGLFAVKAYKHRPQHTIHKWKLDDKGYVSHAIQNIDGKYLEIPIAKTIYVVNNGFTTSPEGVGLFRHLVEPALRLANLEKLEAIGFDNDLRGIPIGRAPLSALNDSGASEQDIQNAVKPIKDLIKNQRKTTNTGLLLDSATYKTQDDAGRPSTTYQYDLQLLRSGGTGLPDIAMAIMRINREMARILGVEQMLLGENREGSFALADSKTKSLFLLADGLLDMIASAVQDHLLRKIWLANGFPEEKMPKLITSDTKFKSVAEVTSALKDIASAGVPLLPDDPAIKEIRDLLGVKT
jgi:hypothetical protein